MRLAVFMIFAASAFAQAKKQGPEPALPYFDWKACPFEGCAYQQWTVKQKIVAYDTWKDGRQPVATLAVGQKVKGMTGVVITFRPGVIVIDRAMPAAKLKAGDKVLTYTYLGEGSSRVWFNGWFYPEFDITFAKWPDGSGCFGAYCSAKYVDLGKKTWWAQIQLSPGKTAWVNMDEAEMDGIDLFAGKL
jgi:hypothetical protein